MQVISSKKKIRIIQLIALIFLTVCGGPYGLEPLLSYVNAHAAILLLIITPVIWDFPTIAAVLELNSMMPVNGGYYQWVKRALGIRWAFYEGWWTWLYTFVDLAIYPVLFVEYLTFFFPEIHAYKIPICLVIIWSATVLNVIGINPVGKVSVLLSAIVVLPFIILIVISFKNSHATIAIPTLSIKGNSYSAIGMALYTIMWNFIGWDNTTTYAGEVNNPIRSYLISVIITFILVFTLYFLTVVISLASGIDIATLKTNGYPALGLLIGGRSLGAAIAIGGMASALGLYSSVLLSISRVPKVMADDKLLPAILERLHPHFNTPYVSIITCSGIVSVMIFLSFEDLVIIDVTLYGAALIMEYISLIVLRIRFPDEHRPFRIPLGIPGLCILFLLPVSVYAVAVSAAFINSGQSLKPIIFAVVALLSAEVLWRIITWRGK